MVDTAGISSEVEFPLEQSLSQGRHVGLAQLQGPFGEQLTGGGERACDESGVDQRRDTQADRLASPCAGFAGVIGEGIDRVDRGRDQRQHLFAKRRRGHALGRAGIQLAAQDRSS